jgi:hypothetical protein
MDERTFSKDTDRPNRRRFQYSLRSLLLFVLFFAMAVSCLTMYWKMKNAEEGLSYYRSLAGNLKIDDDKLFYAIALDSKEPNTWRWRVYIPKYSSISWHLDYCTMPPDQSTGSITGESLISNEMEEAEIVLSLIEEQGNKAHIVAYFRSPKSNHKIEDSVIPSVFLQQIEEKMAEMERLGSRGMETRRPGEEITFLKIRLKNSNGTKKPAQKPEPGITFTLKLKP